MKKRRSTLILEVDPAITDRVRARITAAIVSSRAEHGQTANDFWAMFPTFKTAFDALPDLEPLMSVAQEMRWIIPDGYKKEGVTIPHHVVTALHLPSWLGML